MDSTVSSKNSFNSTFTCEESNCAVNLNNAILVSDEEDILSDSGDEIFHDANVSPQLLKNFEPEMSTSITNGAVQKKYSLNFSGCTDSTNYNSLRSMRKQLKFNFFPMENSNSFPSYDMQHEQDTDTEEENNKIDKRVPLSAALRRMFDNIIKKHTKPAKNLTLSNETSNSKFPLINNSSSVIRSADTFLRNDGDPLYEEQKSDKSVAPTEHDLEDSSHNNSSLSESTSVSFQSRVLPRPLVTILENSNESVYETQLESFSGHSEHMGRLSNSFLSKLRNPHYIQGKMFNTSDTNSSEHNISSNTSTNIEIMQEEIIRNANNLRGNDSLIFRSENGKENRNKTFNINNGDYQRFPEFMNLETTGTDRLTENGSETENHTDSVHSELGTSSYLSDFEDSDDSSAFLSATDTASIELSTMNQSIDKKTNNSTTDGIKMKFKEKNIKYNDSPILNGQQNNNKSNVFLQKKISPLFTNRIEKTRTKLMKKFLTPTKSRKKSRRSLSLPDAAIEAENKTPKNQKCSNSKSLRTGRFYDRTNKAVEWNGNSPIHHRSNSFNVITSPIKSVEYLRNFFTNIANGSESSIKQSPMVRKFKRIGVPFISVTPATPPSRI